MTHKDIYTKFMIEYDKANVTSSYPSLTEYEVATFLDKAYNALISQKVVGNNFRRSTLESDLKAISDIQPLITTESRWLTKDSTIADNVVTATLPDGFLYFVSAQLFKRSEYTSISYERVYDTTLEDKGDGASFYVPLDKINVGDKLDFDGNLVNVNLCYFDNNEDAFVYIDLGEDDPGLYNIKDNFVVDSYTYTTWDHAATDSTKRYLLCIESLYSKQILTPNELLVVYRKREDKKTIYPLDGQDKKGLTVRLVSHDVAQKFFSTYYNIPWIKEPVCYIENNSMYIVYDPIDVPTIPNIYLSYITKPHPFVKDLNDLKSGDRSSYTFYFFLVEDENDLDVTELQPEYIFECNDTVAEELISLAVSFALENVESRRLNTKLNMRGLES